MNSIFPVLILFLLCMLQTQAQTGKSDNTVMIASVNRGSKPKRAECGSRGTLGKKCINRRICTKEPGTKPTCKGPKSLEIEPNFYCGDRNSVGRICKRGGICIRSRKRFRCKRENPATERPPPSNSQKDTGILLLTDNEKEGGSVESYGCNRSLSVPVRCGHGGGGATVLNGKLLIYCYNINSCYYGSLESTESWVVTKNCLSRKTYWASWTSFGNFILMTGGTVGKMHHGSLNSDQIQRYDGTTWITLKNKLTSKRERHCSIAISDSELIVLGGYDSKYKKEIFLPNVEKYSSADGKLIKSLQNMKIARSNHGCALYNKELYVAGGEEKRNTELDDVEVYNLETNQWRQINKMNSPRCMLALHVINNRLTVLGGKSEKKFGGFRAGFTIEYLDENGNWIISPDSLKIRFTEGTSVQVKCPA